MIANQVELDGMMSPGAFGATSLASFGGLPVGFSQLTALDQNLTWLFAANRNAPSQLETSASGERTADSETGSEDNRELSQDASTSPEFAVLSNSIPFISAIAIPWEPSAKDHSAETQCQGNDCSNGVSAGINGISVQREGLTQGVEVLPKINSTEAGQIRVDVEPRQPASSVPRGPVPATPDPTTLQELSLPPSKLSGFWRSESVLPSRQEQTLVQSESRSTVVWREAFSLSIASIAETPSPQGNFRTVEDSWNALHVVQPVGLHSEETVSPLESFFSKDMAGETGNEAGIELKSAGDGGQSSDSGGQESPSNGQTGGSTYGGKEKDHLESGVLDGTSATSEFRANPEVLGTNSQVNDTNNPTPVTRLAGSATEHAASVKPLLPSPTPWEARVWESARAAPAISRSFAPIREIDLRLPVDNQMVDVHLREKAGHLDISVRTGDPVLAKEMQAGLGELVRSLETQGYEATSPQTVVDGSNLRGAQPPSGARPDTNSQNSSPNDGSKGGDPSGGQGRQDGKRSRNGNSQDETFQIDETNSQGGSSK